MLIQVWLYTAALAVFIFAHSLPAAESDFFHGKTIRIIVGTSPGGGFDVYSQIGRAHV